MQASADECEVEIVQVSVFSVGRIRACDYGTYAEFLGADCVFADTMSPETGIMSVVRAGAWREQAFCFLPRSLLL